MNKNVIPDGTRDLTNEDCIKRNKIINTINSIFISWGYKEVITPSIEFYDSFRYEYSGLREEKIYKFFDSKGRILALRPDMTIPIVRLVSTRFKDINESIKLRYTSNIFRVFEDFSGKRNEYTECGIELITKEKNFSDLEVLIIAIEALKKVGANNFKIEIGEANFFKAAIEDLDISNEEKILLSELIENKKLQELKVFLEGLNLEDKIKDTFYKLPLIFGEGIEVLNDYKEISFNNNMLESIKTLENLAYRLEALGYKEYITFDLGITARVNYYTGIIFRGFIKGSGSVVLSGGRYDNLIKSAKKGFNAIGFSINVDELANILTMNFDKKIKFKILFSKDKEIEAIKESIRLRNEGFVVELIPSNEEKGIKLLREECYGD
ncbi:MAG: ATP phosphoribosyltransferase regulatory subunit [Clostridium sp.]|uniref:ATP phosphoribosyltransferase regulatory subunit n=1 Tax=Clostridium sp. TaxID=1506 RepID=UPI0025C4818E|nr:ATP phosphoribosyltransferase regulatory subunit [Clostridium sp.]MCF0147628.1 ATP phosphoribosyltransferase regulatory subunit [Clostridium sp.]